MSRTRAWVVEGTGVPPIEGQVSALWERASRLHRSVAEQAYAATKRGMDIAVAVAGLIVTAPILLAAAVAIRINGGAGPIFYCQRRAGRDGRPFTMYKLRTMHRGADDDKELFRNQNELPSGPCFKMRNDPRITPVGKWLRRTSIDELPQLWNVLRGEMSLVGPRPLPLDEVRRDSSDERLRLRVKPGLTCLWQISGRVEIPYAEWIALDVWYARNRSLALDLMILVKTLPAVVSGRGAY